MSIAAARMDPHQSLASKTQATSEQIRLAQILEFSRTDDPDTIRSKIKQVRSLCVFLKKKCGSQ